jgi:hypothetical protein
MVTLSPPGEPGSERVEIASFGQIRKVGRRPQARNGRWRKHLALPMVGPFVLKQPRLLPIDLFSKPAKVALHSRRVEDSAPYRQGHYGGPVARVWQAW